MVYAKYFFHYLWSSWIDALSLLQPSRAKLLLFATHKNIFQTYRLLIVLFGWMVPFFIILSCVTFPSLSMVIIPCLSVVWSVITVWSARSSMSKKTYRYYVSSCVLMIQVIMCGLFFEALRFLSGFYSLWLLGSGIYAPLYVIFSFFMSDSLPLFSWDTYKFNIKNSCIMLITNLPIIVLLSLGTHLFLYMLGSLYGWSEVIFFPLFACSIYTIYVQRRSEQPDMYMYEQRST